MKNGKSKLESLLQGILIGSMGRVTNFDGVFMFPYAVSACRDEIPKFPKNMANWGFYFLGVSLCYADKIALIQDYFSK